MDCAPIAFFAYKRPQHTLRALEALSGCELADASRLVVFCDGPKRPEDVEAVRQVREVVKSRQWCGTVEVVEREKNIGLANSITSGVSDLCRQYGRVIVLEDDLIVSPYFLRYMNDALGRYHDDERIMQISGYMFDVELSCDSDAIFLPYTTSWGWATWQRAWVRFDKDMKGYELLQADKKRRNAFNLDGRCAYFSMLEQQMLGKIDSWAIKWYLSVFMTGGLVLHPVASLVSNTGFDGSGTHGGVQGKGGGGLRDLNRFANCKFPEQVSVSKLKEQIYRNVIGVSSTSLLKRVGEKLSRIFFRGTTKG